MAKSTAISIPTFTSVKDTLIEGLKGGVVGAIGLGIGQMMFGDVGEFIGACIAGAALRGTAGTVITVYGCMDAILDMFGGEV